MGVVQHAPPPVSTRAIIHFDRAAPDPHAAVRLQAPSTSQRLRELVDNSAVSDDENVSLIASEVVGLREKMVSLQGRLVPLFKLATVCRQKCGNREKVNWFLAAVVCVVRVCDRRNWLVVSHLHRPTTNWMKTT